MTSLAATLRGEITSGYPEPDVWIYWGLTDRNTDRELWDHSVHIGPVTTGPFSANVPLTPGLTYYYRCYASNTVDSVWTAADTLVSDRVKSRQTT